jgi:predicted nucleotidyltransferase
VATRLRDEARRRDQAARERADALREKLGAAAALSRGAGARRVWVFGSLMQGVPRPESDVDLATEGLAPARYFDLLAALMELFGTRVDLVRLEAAPASLRERVLETGTEL